MTSFIRVEDIFEVFSGTLIRLSTDVSKTQRAVLRTLAV